MRCEYNKYNHSFHSAHYSTKQTNQVYLGLDKEEFYYRHNPKSIIFGHTHIKEKNLNINNNVTSTIINQSFYI
jgi:hypothetical protein